MLGMSRSNYHTDGLAPLSLYNRSTTQKTRKKTVRRGPVRKAMRQRIQSSRIPPCHRHMAIAATLSAQGGGGYEADWGPATEGARDAWGGRVRAVRGPAQGRARHCYSGSHERHGCRAGPSTGGAGRPGGLMATGFRWAAGL